MDDRLDRDILRELVRRVDLLHEDLIGRTDEIRDEVHAQSEAIMRIIDRIGPADPPDWGE